MKACPFFAEEIQDEAIVCRFCGRDLNQSAQATRSTKRVSLGRIILLLLVAVGIFVAYVGYVVLSRKDSAGLPGARQRITIRIGDGKPQEIKPTQYINYTVTLPDRPCTLSGRVEGVAGANRDFEAFILDDDSFRNWSTSHQARGISSGNVVVWTPNVPLRGPGVYHLVVSNAFSVVSSKLVTLQATVECP